MSSSNGSAVVDNASTPADPSDDTVDFTPSTGFRGVGGFTYLINDGTEDSENATVTVTVNRLNHAPVAVDDTTTADEDTLLTIDLLDNDTDQDGDPISIVSITYNGTGSVVDNNDGTVKYTPSTDFNGQDSFSYTINDSEGSSDSATVTVNVNPIPDAPVAVDDGVTTDEDTAVTISVLTNDFDPDGTSCSLSDATNGTHGATEQNPDGTITYTPDVGFRGSDSFEYTIIDESSSTDTGHVDVRVGGLQVQEDFDDGTAEQFSSQSGNWVVEGSEYLATAQRSDQNVISLLQVEEQLPLNMDVRVTFNADPIAGTRWSNAFIVFDYKSPTDFKFAGAFVGIDHWTIGRMTARGYVMDAAVSERIDANVDYDLHLQIEGNSVTLNVGGVEKVGHIFDETLNDGELGLVTLKGNCRFDDFSARET